MAKQAEFFEVKQTAVNEVMSFAAEHDDSQVALMAAYLAPALPESPHVVTNVAYCLREVSRVLAARFDELTDHANEGADVRERLGVEAVGAVDAIDALRALLVELQRDASQAPAST